MFLLLFFVLVFLFLFASIKKAEISQWYGVTRPTFNKWIRYFSSRIDYEKWKPRRKLTGFEVLSIIGEFGWPADKDYLDKGQIKDHCETEYHTVADVVALNSLKLGFGVVTYHSVDKFPPMIGRRIVAVME